MADKTVFSLVDEMADLLAELMAVSLAVKLVGVKAENLVVMLAVTMVVMSESY